MTGLLGVGVWVELGLAVVTFAALLRITAPYGRHTRAGWGPTVPVRVGWAIMESPAVLVFAAVYLAGDHRADLAPLALLGLWQTHYLHRAALYPLRLRGRSKRTPVVVIASGVAFNALNASINARFISHVGRYDASWLADPRFVIGAALFAVGLVVNLRADAALRRLRRPGETGYQIPRGGLYERISCPNYAGEMLEWSGWAVAAWSPAGLAFAVYTAANLVPRALDHHAWYRRTFPDYPPERKALVPYLL